MLVYKKIRIYYFSGTGNSEWVAKEVAKESLIESITDPKTGTQVFVKDYDTDPYAINVGGIIKSRKDAKKKKGKEILDEY